MAKFFRALPWHTLQPSGTAIVWDSSAPNGTQRPYAKADSAGDYIVAYLPQANGDPHTPEGPPGTPAIGCRPPGGSNHTNYAAGMYGGTAKINTKVAHTASWFNPRTGEKTLISQLSKGRVTWAVPVSRPGGVHEAWRDWVLLIEPKSARQSIDLQREESVLIADKDEFSDVSWVVNVSAKGRIRPAPVENGCSFVATQTMTVTQLCRFQLASNNNIETVAIFPSINSTATDATSSAIATSPIATAKVDALSKQRDEHGFVCAPVDTKAGYSGSTPPVLVQGRKYFLTQIAKCDAWHDDTGTTIEVVGGDAAKVASFYGTPPNGVKPGGGGLGHCYGPLNFHFTS